jgi:hypothetical protein
VTITAARIALPVTYAGAMPPRPSDRAVEAVGADERGGGPGVCVTVPGVVMDRRLPFGWDATSIATPRCWSVVAMTPTRLPTCGVANIGSSRSRYSAWWLRRNRRNHDPCIELFLSAAGRGPGRRRGSSCQGSRDRAFRIGGVGSTRAGACQSSCLVGRPIPRTRLAGRDVDEALDARPGLKAISASECEGAALVSPSHGSHLRTVMLVLAERRDVAVCEAIVAGRPLALGALVSARRAHRGAARRLRVEGSTTC